MKFFDSINDSHRAFIARQHVFFIATAAADARINLSPKGMDSFRILDAGRVGYLDVGGSGNEMQAHLNADGRATIMFCAFDQPALILRIYGQGRAILPQDARWEEVAGQFAMLPGTRQIFEFDVDSLQESCGWGVPVMTFDHERQTLNKFHAQQIESERLAELMTRTESIDGLPLRVQSIIPRVG